MGQFVIQGRRPVGGTRRVPGNKNAALPMLAATLLTEEPVVLSNLPLIQDVRVMLDLLRGLGAEVELDEPGRAARIRARKITTTTLDKTLCNRVRGSVLFAGALLGRRGNATLFAPGGDVIGRRRLDTHVEGLRALGAKARMPGKSGKIVFDIPVSNREEPAGKGENRLRGGEVLLDEASVTATENMLMAASRARGETVVYNAACEPHVQDLCGMLARMGADIGGVGTNRLTVRGAERLGGGEFTVGADSVDAGSFVVASLVTGGELTLEGVSPPDFKVLERPFKRFGVRWSLNNTRLHVPGRQRLRMRYDLGDVIPKVEDGPWPGFPSDLMSVLIVLATQTRGTALFFEKMFESRMYFVDHLIGMGARIVQCDPHRVVVTGPAPLNAGRVTSPDIRAGMALLIAALCAKGETTILNAESIDRGYEGIDGELGRLGAEIKRM
ncbi:MAG: UDP-N-acetylglucosamine 1-carboxyvinyltransferase [Kiritimatiellaeota bacterium]|nr:UDP-N-acetylglucosamine 1-carboxyvinyltransferase [Kiritimatiellota bacterium]